MNRNDTLTLASRMRKMWHNLERIGVAAILEPNEQIVVLRKPTMREFREAVTAGGVPEPRSWVQFYELTFGEFIERRITQ